MYDINIVHCTISAIDNEPLFCPSPSFNKEFHHVIEFTFIHHYEFKKKRQNLKTTVTSHTPSYLHPTTKECIKVLVFTLSCMSARLWGCFGQHVSVFTSKHSEQQRVYSHEGEEES